ncbi:MULTISPECIES: nuclease-related domain-containing protein [Acinetobacter]|nr:MULTISPECIES: nuclease-related domain-containing protein [Acinetobacter]
MTIHAYYGDISHLKNEQKMFDDLLTQLKLHWGNSEDWIYLFYNTMWSGQEIDVIAFTKEAIVVIDLKNYSGNLVGSENGEWLINGE